MQLSLIFKGCKKESLLFIIYYLKAEKRKKPIYLNFAKMEERRGTISSQGSTQATSMRPPRSIEAGIFFVFNYFFMFKIYVFNLFGLNCKL